ncbi:hypothetical protein HJO_16350 [Hyphomonas johnsonii MHS-2]|uniref:Uncharacterized protein n=1 Tax=Hyphomonas johnsonii MHS-2 TaxID=1280950 RepID=A0A059FBJ7_9PROT|nr:hypothetical protein HJO_16350 [Hyphomonas johnsonii MHS-2]
MRAAIALRCFLKEFQGSGFVALPCDIGFENSVFMVDSPPKIVPLAAYLHEYVVQVLPLMWATSHRFRSAFPDFASEVCAEPIDPETDVFVADIDAALVEKVFNVSQGRSGYWT